MQWDRRGVLLTAGAAASAVFGNGAVISPDGYVLTAHHVVAGSLGDGPIKPWVIVYNGGQPRALLAEAVWHSVDADLALLKVALTNAAHFEWSPPLHRGAPVIQGGIKSFGRVGQLRFDMISDEPGTPFLSVYHSAQIRRGDSGGPLIDEHGNLIGINTDWVWLEPTPQGFIVTGARVARPNREQVERIIHQHRARQSGDRAMGSKRSVHRDARKLWDGAEERSREAVSPRSRRVACNVSAGLMPRPCGWLQALN